MAVNSRSVSQLLLIALLVAISITQLPRAPNTVSPIIAYGAVIAVYLPFCIVFLTRTDGFFKAERVYLALFAAFGVIAALRTLVSPSPPEILRLGAFLVFTGANLFILPHIVPLRDFLSTTARFSAALVIIGFLPYLGLSGQASIIDISLWHGQLYLWPSLHPITSVYSNPNALGFLALAGSLAAIGEWRVYHHAPGKYLLTINLLGLLISNYRGGMLAFSAAAMLLAIYWLAGPSEAAVATAGGICATALGLLMVFHVLPAPRFLTELSLNNRRALWTAGYHAILDQPLTGHGLGTIKTAMVPFLPPGTELAGIHNSYLRMFVTLGVFGGLLYLVFMLRSVVQSARQASTPKTVFVSAFIVAGAVVQLFNGLSIFGTSLHSTVLALAIGYHASGEIS